MIPAREFVEQARARDFSFYAGVPCSYLTPFIDCVIGDRSLQYVSSANEGDAVATAAGAQLGGRRAVVMMQNSGLGNAVSPLASLTWVFRIPVLLIVTLRGDREVPDEPQHLLMGAITTRVLEDLEIPFAPFPDQPEQIAPALERACAHLEREERPFALLLRRGSVTASATPPGRAPWQRTRPERAPVSSFYAGVDAARRPTRREALERITAATADGSAIVIATTGHTGRELYALDDRPNHLYMVGSMGCASSLGLGLSLARPERKVVVVDGDGAALMRMGNFATLGSHAGDNLVHVVLDNEVHDSTGGQATVSANVSFAGVASACGYGLALEGDQLALLDRLFEASGARGPRLAQLKIRPGTTGSLPRPSLLPEQVKRRLQEHLAKPGPV